MEREIASDSRLKGRPREFDMDDALDRAIDVFRQRGYTGASLAELAEGMNLSRGSLYKAFKHKQSVFIAAYDRYASAGARRLNDACEGPGTARERIEAVLNLYAGLSHGDEGLRGCLVIATAVELSVADPEIAQRVLASWQRIERVLLRLLEEGARDGSIRNIEDKVATAKTILCLLQGMRIIGKSPGAGGVAMRRVAHEALRLLD